MNWLADVSSNATLMIAVAFAIYVVGVLTGLGLAEHAARRESLRGITPHMRTADVRLIERQSKLALRRALDDMAFKGAVRLASEPEPSPTPRPRLRAVGGELRPSFDSRKAPPLQ